MADGTDSGWSLVAREDEGAAVIAGLVELDPDREYTRSELAESAGIPLKTLYLVDILDELERVGMLSRVDDETDDSEATFAIEEDSNVYTAAVRFDSVVADRLDDSQ